MISVIVPVFNAAPYLVQCIRSVLAQTCRDIELLLVDDGSTDRSAAICDSYATLDPCVRVIHKENGGLSSARNAGVAQARGECVFFLDADDWIAPDALRLLLMFMRDRQCEAVQCGVFYAYVGRMLTDATSFGACETLRREEAMRLLMRNHRVKNFAWGKLYKTDILRGQEFPVGKYFEDCYWQHRVLHSVQSYGILPIPLYYYRQRTDGISGQLTLRGLDLLRGYEERLRFIGEHYPRLTAELLRTYLATAFAYLTQAHWSGDKALRSAYREYWKTMTRRHGTLMERTLGGEYRLRRRIARLRLCWLYDLWTRARRKQRH